MLYLYRSISGYIWNFVVCSLIIDILIRILELIIEFLPFDFPHSICFLLVLVRSTLVICYVYVIVNRFLIRSKKKIRSVNSDKKGFVCEIWERFSELRLLLWSKDFTFVPTISVIWFISVCSAYSISRTKFFFRGEEVVIPKIRKLCKITKLPVQV